MILEPFRKTSVRITAVTVKLCDSALPAWAGYEFDLPSKTAALDTVTDWTSSYTNHTLLRLTSITASSKRWVFTRIMNKALELFLGAQQMTISGTQCNRLD